MEIRLLILLLILFIDIYNYILVDYQFYQLFICHLFIIKFVYLYSYIIPILFYIIIIHILYHITQYNILLLYIYPIS
jgi:hypothetical protein